MDDTLSNMTLFESDKTEFKTKWEDDSCLKTISAFANSHGGRLYIGLDDQSKPVGTINTKKLLEDIPNKIVSKCGLIPRVYTQTLSEQKIVVVEIEKASVAISYNGQFFTRIGSTTQAFQGKELTQFLLERSGSSWDEYVLDESNINDINLDTIKTFKDEASSRLSGIDKPVSLETLLEKLNLVTHKKLKRAAILLFGNNPKRFFTNAYLRIGKFDKDGTLVSSDTVEGNLFEQVTKAMEILRTKYLISTLNIEGLYRTETLEIPEEALRETITNALIHRDYIGAHTQIKLYPDKAVFWNSGGLPDSLSLSDLKTNHPSKPRNDLLADIFFKAGLVETWGTGTQKIYKACEKAGLFEPEFKEEFGGFSVSFYKDKLATDIIQKLDINDRQKRTITHLKENRTISNSQYQKLFSVSKGTATKELADLVAKSILIREGTIGAGTFYKLDQLQRFETEHPQL